jgi:hypothetical protein
VKEVVFFRVKVWQSSSTVSGCKDTTIFSEIQILALQKAAGFREIGLIFVNSITL